MKKYLIVVELLCFLRLSLVAQWQDLSNPSLGDILYCQFISPENGWIINLGDPPLAGLLRTTDGGITWTKILNHPPGTFNWIVGSDFRNDSIGYVVSLRGTNCFRTLTGGRIWDTAGCGNADLVDIIPTIKIFSLTLSYCGGGTAFSRSVDSMKTWRTISRIPNARLFSGATKLAFLSENDIVSCGGIESELTGEWTGMIECYRSTDGGTTWGSPFVDTLQVPYAMAFGNTMIGYTFTGITHDEFDFDVHYRTHKTTDGGATWFQIPARLDSGEMIYIEDAYFKSPLEGFVCNGTAFAHTSNGGLSWKIIPGVSGGSMSWPDSLHGWVVGNNGRIFRTTTGGWLPIQLASFTGAYLGGTRVRLDWRTLSEINNYGVHVQRRGQNDSLFTEISPLIPGHGTTNEPHDYLFIDSSATINRWYYRLRQIDLNGPIHYTEPIIVDVTTGVTQAGAPREYSLEHNYPNPFNPTTTIRYSIPNTSHVRLKVFDVLGREVATLVDEVQDSGRRSVVFDAAHLASGVYLYKLQAGSCIQTRKLVLLH